MLVLAYREKYSKGGNARWQYGLSVYPSGRSTWDEAVESLGWPGVMNKIKFFGGPDEDPKRLLEIAEILARGYLADDHKERFSAEAVAELVELAVARAELTIEQAARSELYYLLRG